MITNHFAFHAGIDSGTELFAHCHQQHQATDGVTSESAIANLVLLCVTEGLAAQQAQHVATTMTWLLLLCGSLVFLMQLGFAALCAGCVRRKNLSNTLLKNILDVCGAAIAFVIVGYSFCFGGQSKDKGYTFLGSGEHFLVGSTSEDFTHWFFHYAVSAAAVTIIAGTLEERCRMVAYACYSMFMTGFVYPVTVHSLWSVNGFLSPFAAKPLFGIGAIDLAGSGVVHLTGGVTALLASWMLGARRGRFVNTKGEVLDDPKTIPGHSISLQVIGGFILWFGWYGFNAGSALLLPDAEDFGAVAALTVVNTSLSTAMGGLSALLANMYLVYQVDQNREATFDLTKTLNGCLSGAVAITAGCGVVEPWAALVIGLTAGIIHLAASKLLIWMRIDDTVDAIPVHLFNGAWGLISVGWLASIGRMKMAYGSDDHAGLFYTIGRGSLDATLLGNQCLAILFIVGWSTFTMLPFFWGLKKLGWLRVDEIEEIAGLDVRYNHAAQEDDSQLKKRIMKEFKHHQREQKEISCERRSHETSVSEIVCDIKSNSTHGEDTAYTTKGSSSRTVASVGVPSPFTATLTASYHNIMQLEEGEVCGGEHNC